MSPRYIVRKVRGMCLGAGGFEVLDTVSGRVTTTFLWREEAELCARRLNAEDARSSA